MRRGSTRLDLMTGSEWVLLNAHQTFRPWRNLETINAMNTEAIVQIQSFSHTVALQWGWSSRSKTFSSEFGAWSFVSCDFLFFFFFGLPPAMCPLRFKINSSFFLPHLGRCLIIAPPIPFARSPAATRFLHAAWPPMIVLPFNRLPAMASQYCHTFMSGRTRRY